MIRTILQDMLQLGSRFSRLDVARFIDFMLDPDVFSHWAFKIDPHTCKNNKYLTGKLVLAHIHLQRTGLKIVL